MTSKFHDISQKKLKLCLVTYKIEFKGLFFLKVIHYRRTFEEDLTRDKNFKF